MQRAEFDDYAGAQPSLRAKCGANAASPCNELQRRHTQMHGAAGRLGVLELELDCPSSTARWVHAFRHRERIRTLIDWPGDAATGALSVARLGSHKAAGRRHPLVAGTVCSPSSLIAAVGQLRRSPERQLSGSAANSQSRPLPVIRAARKSPRQ